MIDSGKKGKNLGVIIDMIIMATSSNITGLCKNLYFKIKKINSIHSYLNERVSKTFVTSFILCTLDHCSNLLASFPKDLIYRLQVVQNIAARYITRSRK